MTAARALAWLKTTTGAGASYYYIPPGLDIGFYATSYVQLTSYNIGSRNV